MPADRQRCFSLLPALLSASATYWLTIYSKVRVELSAWERYARTIPDPVLRAQALYKLTAERLNPEAAAFFAVLAPRQMRSRVVRLIVAYQVLYDYIDAINELPECSSLQNGLRLHGALIDSVRPTPPTPNRQEFGAVRDDGGYAEALAGVCQRQLQTLASVKPVEPLLLRAVDRVCSAQSHNHAIVSEGEDGLVQWCLDHSQRGYLWWEIAAGGISCLGVHALFVLAAGRYSTVEEAIQLDAAYFPPVCALSALLDSLSDHYSDAGTTNHSFTARYRDGSQAAERMTAIATEAGELVAGLRHCRRHSVMLAGIVVFYLSSTSVRAGFCAPVTDRLMRTIGPIAWPMRAAMRIRRCLHAPAQSVV